MRILVDEAIVGLSQRMAAYGEVMAVPGRAIDSALVRDADALFVRTVTPVTEQLLAGSRVRFVATATIGTDHLDLGYLAAKNIVWASAQGCNALAVAQYVVAMWLSALPLASAWPLRETFGIVGYGHVGRCLQSLLHQLAVPTALCDPPLVAQGRLNGAVELDHLLSTCRWISLHVPLVRQGPWATLALLSSERLQAFGQRGHLLINTSRGSVIARSDWQAFVNHQPTSELRFAFDVWDGEPHLSWASLQKDGCWRWATPHVAGYSLEGKVQATKLVEQAFVAWHHPQSQWPSERRPLHPVVGGHDLHIDVSKATTLLAVLQRTIAALSTVDADDAALRSLALASGDRALQFERLRTHYLFRREFAAQRVWLHGLRLGSSENMAAIATLRALGVGEVRTLH